MDKNCRDPSSQGVSLPSGSFPYAGTPSSRTSLKSSTHPPTMFDSLPTVNMSRSISNLSIRLAEQHRRTLSDSAPPFASQRSLTALSDASQRPPSIQTSGASSMFQDVFPFETYTSAYHTPGSDRARSSSGEMFAPRSRTGSYRNSPLSARDQEMVQSGPALATSSRQSTPLFGDAGIPRIHVSPPRPSLGTPHNSEPRSVSPKVSVSRESKQRLSPSSALRRRSSGGFSKAAMEVHRGDTAATNQATFLRRSARLSPKQAQGQTGSYLWQLRFEGKSLRNNLQAAVSFLHNGLRLGLLHLQA